MKSTLRTIFVSATLALSAFTAVTLTSCTEDKCKGIACAYGGTCTEGKCNCPAGYEGPQCETVNNVRFMGDWYVKEDGTRSNAAQYTVSVEGDGDPTRIKITNFRNLLHTVVKGTVKGDTLTIAQQTIDGYTIQGWGILTEDLHYGEHGRMTLWYSLTDPMGVVDDFGLADGEPSLWNK